MPAKKQIQPGAKAPLHLTAAERRLVLEGLILLDQEYEQIIRNTPASKPVMMTLVELDDLGGFIAAEANHCDDRKKGQKLDAVFAKIQDVLDAYTDEEPPATLKLESARKQQAIANQAAQIAEFAAQALSAATQLRIKTKLLVNFTLAPAQREVLLLVSGLSTSVMHKLANQKPLTVAELAQIAMALAEELLAGDLPKQVALTLVAKHLIDQLQAEIMAKGAAVTAKKPPRRSHSKPSVLYQFKITLLETNPPIWRRIQVPDGTLDKLHEHLQTAMGWTNSHLHQFDIQGERYGDPELLGDDFEDFEGHDSTAIFVSDILPELGQQFAFNYEYDFGDSWEHEVLYEGSLPVEPGQTYPLCLEGERACPPEDVGGVWGFAEYLAALADPQHERHREYLKWSGRFNPNRFDPKQATQQMRQGLPDWRTM